jgi:hypothetical protein
MNTTFSILRIGQVRQTHAFGRVRITTIEKRIDERIVHCKSIDGHHDLILSPSYALRLAVEDNHA